jgi:hypothetical protein
LTALSCASLVQAATPDIAITPATLDFKYTDGAALPVAQALQVKSTGAALSPLPLPARFLTRPSG